MYKIIRWLVIVRKMHVAVETKKHTANYVPIYHLIYTYECANEVKEQTRSSFDADY